MTIGNPIVRSRWLILAAWLVGAVALAMLVGGVDPSASEQTSFLPDDTPHAKATMAIPGLHWFEVTQIAGYVGDGTASSWHVTLQAGIRKE